MKFTAAQVSYQGGRPYNEDAVFHYNGEQLLLVIVADGLGGHGGGEIASRTVVQTISRQFLGNPVLSPENIKAIFDSANTATLSVQTRDCQMKSTAVCLFYHEPHFAYAHVGDSRLYRFHKGRLCYQTKDHSVSQMAALSGEISPDQIRFHEDRNKVLRAFGSDVSIRPEIAVFKDEALDDDAFLLCTDGFWEYVLEDEMEMDLAKAEDPDQWLRFMIARLGKRVDGKNDNFTAAAVFATKRRNVK